MDELSQTLPEAHAPASLSTDAFQRRVEDLERELLSTYEHVPFGSHSLTADGRFAEVNAIELTWLGEDLAALAGKQRFVDFLTPQSQIDYQRISSNPAFSSHFEDLALDLLRKDGSIRPISLSSVSICGTDGQVTRHRDVLFDMTLVKRQEMKTRIAASAFESLSGMFVADQRGGFIQVNQAFAAVTGHSADAVPGRTARTLKPPLMDKAAYRLVKAAIEDHGSWEGELVGRRKDGASFVGWMNVCALTDATGKTERLVGSLIDITANKAAEAAVNRLAYFDSLTQLPNRKLMFDRINQALISAHRTGLGGAVMFIDLDNFKAVNDTRGHEVGDMLLVEVAKRLQAAVREGDSVARQSGDEFLMLLVGLSPHPETAALQAGHVADKLQLALSAPYFVEGQEHHCTASIGIDTFAAAATVSSLLQHADLAMYQSKKTGRNRVSLFDHVMQVTLQERVTLEQQLRLAVVKHQFELHFQPQVDHQDKVRGAEVLLRWKHPEWGLVSPLKFIGVAEETGLMLPIGQWVLEAACAQLKAWDANALTRHVQLAVNVSPLQFRQDDFVAQIERTLQHSGIEPKRLKLEITESMLIDVSDTSSKMLALQALGVGFAMDDFGTGYSSLSTLSRLPLSRLKIDQSFVQNIGLQEADAVIVQTIIVMAHALGMEVIAEGVETQAQRDFLLLNGCKMYQGYLLGRPMPVSDFEALLVDAKDLPGPA